MEEFHLRHPGWPQVAAALLPLAVGALTLGVAAVRNLVRRGGTEARSRVWPLLNCGGLAISAGLSAVGVTGFSDYLNRYGESVEWVRLGPATAAHKPLVLTVGYHVDFLTALLFVLVTVVASLVFIFSLGYMADEQQRLVEDHEARVERRGRPDRYFAYLSLFVSAMLGLLLADHLFQLFVCWELVGASSYLLIGFYHERQAAGAAAIKAFVVNRVGDAGFLFAIMIAWTAFGTLDINELMTGTERAVKARAWMELHRGSDLNGVAETMKAAGFGPKVGFGPGGGWWDQQLRDAEQTLKQHGEFSYTIWLLMGGGLFLGCVGKSAQVPLHVWLPDAMAGPTPVSALIHAATMVAAGVYLVARCHGLFAPEILLVIAYIGAATMLLGATAACVQTDIKKVLAYSTCSQLGMMMLALGIGVVSGGWAAGMFHLVTHACFKALLFLGAGAVIFALHHEQDLRYMGGLRGRLPVTAVAMLVGVLAAAGFPPLSGWYSKEAIFSATATFAVAKPQHMALFVIPLLTAWLTAFYMARLWLLVFVGKPRDAELHAHAHEPPAVMLGPLLVLTTLTLVVGLGLPPWEPKASVVGHELAAFANRFRDPIWTEFQSFRSAYRKVETYHLAVEVAAGLMALIGVASALVRYGGREPTIGSEPFVGLRSFLVNAWGFDAVYRVLVVRPVLWLASMTAAADKRPGAADGTGSDPTARRFDYGTLDGWLNAVGLSAVTAGGAARRVQAGCIRGYVLALGLTVVGLLGMLAVLLP